MSLDPIERVVSLVERRGPVVLADAETQVGKRLTEKEVGSLRRRVDVLAKKTRWARVNRPHIWLASKASLAGVLKSDELLVSLLRLKRTEKTHAWTTTAIRDLLSQSYHRPFTDEIDRRIRDGRWPPSVGAIRAGRSYLLLLLDDLHRSGPRPVASGALAVPGKRDESPPTNGPFPEAFDQAFARLDRRGDNRVALRDLRRELPAWSATTFDREVGLLVSAGRYFLEPFEGRHAAFDPSLAAGGIEEAGYQYVYAARRRHD